MKTVVYGLPDEQIDALISGRHAEPFAVLGQHAAGDDTVVRSLQPQASSVTVLCEDGRSIAMNSLNSQGLFACTVPGGAGRYRLQLTESGVQREIIDPYSLPAALGELDRYLFAEGTHLNLYEALGAHITTHEGVDGVRFAVWAPNATRCSVVGEFNDWDGRRHVMRRNFGSGVWDLFVPDLGAGTLYKFELLGPDGALLPLKHDPFGQYFEQAPANAAIVFNSRFVWNDEHWLQGRASQDPLRSPISIYELHPASWRRHDDGRVMSYAEMADELIPYMQEQGFTHIELLPVSEHPFSGSWGYQPIGLYAPTSRFGSPDDFRQLVDRCHSADIGVIIDWVPAHFPTDAHGLGLYDGTHLYEHADPRQGVHRDWETLIFNYGRREVCNYLLSNALYWLREFHIDGLRVDAVASMLYLDYSREPGDWVPNQHGGRENLEAIEFLQRMNTLVHAEGGITFAEESTSFPGVSHPVYAGGLGFTFKWNMGWMHDILEYLAHEPVHRPWHHNQLTFGLLYAFSENFVLPLSHDEVVHGKGSLLNKMPGDRWQQHANLRLLYAFMLTYPGKKLLFMGAELAQPAEWAHDGQLDWWLLEHQPHAGTQQLIADLNRLYRTHPALYTSDSDAEGFAWISCEDSSQSVVSFERRATGAESGNLADAAPIVAVFNFTPIVREQYRIGVPVAGPWRELLNSDAQTYGGSNIGNGGQLQTESVPEHGQPQSLSLTLPPLGALILIPEQAG